MKILLGLLLGIMSISAQATAISESQAISVLKGDAVKSTATQNLFTNGFFSKKAFAHDAESYRGYYFPQKPLTFFNYNVIALDVPHVSIDVGCCVLAQNSFILVGTTSSSIDGLESFAKKHQCTVSDYHGAIGDIADPVAVRLVKSWNTTYFTSIKCGK